MRRCADVVLCLTLAAVACSDAPAPASSATDTSTSAVAPATTESSSGSSSGAPARQTEGADVTGVAEAGGPPMDVGQGEVRFVALGDAGEGNEGQYAVAAAIATVCEERGCDFALYLGDNFYDYGVDSPMDVQFDEKFEAPYAVLDFPFYVTLGNHDYGVIGADWTKSAHQVEYSTISAKWTLPSEYYSFQQNHVHFVSLDTAQVFWDHETDAQKQFLQQDLAGLQDTWIIAFGHHPYISNGEHGNAGNYEGLGGVIGGNHLLEFFEEGICGQAHVYISGHDHNRQWLLPQCGTEFIVSGGGSKTTEFVYRDNNPKYWDEDQSEGFLWVEIIDNTFTGVFYDREGNPEYERSLVL